MKVDSTNFSICYLHRDGPLLQNFLLDFQVLHDDVRVHTERKLESQGPVKSKKKCDDNDLHLRRVFQRCRRVLAEDKVDL